MGDQVNFKLVLLFVLFFNVSDGEDVRKFCPRSCVCDMWEGLRRADCSQQRLVNAQTDVPDKVEILDLSRNDISELNDHTFQNFSRVIELSLTHNKISVISLNAFAPMVKIRKLDLSYNWLGHFDYRILENNKELYALDISANNFMTLANRPIVQSRTLEILYIKDAKLSNINQQLFTEVPNLRELDISQNFLASIENMSAFSKLKHLEDINLDDNNWECDQGWKLMLKWFKKREIKVKRNQCIKKKVSAEKILTNITEAPREDVDIDLVWNNTEVDTIKPEDSIEEAKITPYDNLLSITCGDAEFFDACPFFGVCKENLSSLYENHAITLRQLQIVEKNHRDAIITMCYVGIFFGALAGGLVMFLICVLKDRNVSHMIEKTNEKQRLRKAIKDRSQFAHEESAPAAPSTSAQQRLSTSIPPSSPVSATRVPSFRNCVDQNLQPRCTTALRSPRQYKRRQDDMPALLKYFRRPLRGSDETQEAPLEETYFLPSPTAPIPTTRRPMSNAISNSSVVYSEINEASNVPAAYCCAQHAAIVRQKSCTPPPPYVDCVIKTLDPCQIPIKRQMSLN